MRCGSLLVGVARATGCKPQRSGNQPNKGKDVKIVGLCVQVSSFFIHQPFRGTVLKNKKSGIIISRFDQLAYIYLLKHVHPWPMQRSLLCWGYFFLPLVYVIQKILFIFFP